MTADDVKFTFDRILDPASASPLANTFRSIDHVDVLDPLTVRFSLKTRFASFLRYMATIPWGAIVAKETVDQLDNAPIGTGPFAFQEHQRDQFVQLKKHPTYYEAGLPYLDGVSHRVGW